MSEAKFFNEQTVYTTTAVDGEAVFYVPFVADGRVGYAVRTAPTDGLDAPAAHYELTPADFGKDEGQ